METENVDYHFILNTFLVEEKKYDLYIEKFYHKFNEELGSIRTPLLALAKCYCEQKKADKFEVIVNFLELFTKESDNIISENITYMRNSLNDQKGE